MEGYLKKILFLESSNFIVQLLRYSVVGGIAAVADISIFSVNTNILGMKAIPANTISFIAGLFLNYFLSRQWVFNQKTPNFRKDFLPFAVIGVIGLLLSNLILFVLIDKRLMYHLLYFLSESMVKTSAKIAATFIVLFWNFIARKKIVF